MTVKVPQVGDRHVSRSTHESYEVLEVRADKGDVNPNPYLVRVSKSPTTEAEAQRGVSVCFCRYAWLPRIARKLGLNADQVRQWRHQHEVGQR